MTTLRSRIQTSLIGLQTRREPGLGEEGDNLIKEIMSLDVRAHDGDTLLVGAQVCRISCCGSGFYYLIVDDFCSNVGGSNHDASYWG